MPDRPTACCCLDRDSCISITKELHELCIPETNVYINNTKNLINKEIPIYNNNYVRQQGLLALVGDFNILSVANRLPVQVFHYNPNDRHTLFREPKFHHIGTPNDNGPRELLTVHPTYEINDAVKELEYLNQLHDNDKELFDSIKDEVVGRNKPTKYTQLLKQYLEQNDNSEQKQKSPVRKKVNNNKTPPRFKSSNITSSTDHAPTADDATSMDYTSTTDDALSTDYAPTADDALSTEVHSLSTDDVLKSADDSDDPLDAPQGEANLPTPKQPTWKTEDYIKITNHAKNSLYKIDEEEVRINNDVKDGLRDVHPMDFNASVLEALKGSGTLEVPSIEKEDFLNNNILVSQTNTTNKYEGVTASCELRQQEFSRRKETREINVYNKKNGQKTTLNEAATIKNKAKHASRKVTVNMNVKMEHIARTLFPVNDLKSKSQADMVKNLGDANYEVLQEDVKFKGKVFCDAVELSSDHISGLWRVRDKKNGDMVAYVDTKGTLPLSEKMSNNWTNGGVGVIYVLVVDAVNLNSIQQAITTMSKYNINHLPLAILWLIRETQQNHAAIEKREDRERKMERIYQHPEYEARYARLVVFLIVLREVFTSYIHLFKIPMLLRRAWIAWNLMRSRWDWMFPLKESVIREECRKYSEDPDNDIIVNDGVIVSCSAQGDDEDVWRWYRTVNTGLSTSNKFLELTLGRTPIELLELITSVFDRGINSTRAEAHIQMMFLSAIRYNGGLPKGELLEGIYHVSHKKRFLIGNETGTFEGVPMDRHIEKVFGFFAPEGLTKSEREDWALAFSHRMNALVGADANNMIGQLSQWLNAKRRDTPQHDATRLMLRRVTEIRPEFEREIGLWLNSRD